MSHSLPPTPQSRGLPPLGAIYEIISNIEKVYSTGGREATAQVRPDYPFRAIQKGPDRSAYLEKAQARQLVTGMLVDTVD